MRRKVGLRMIKDDEGQMVFQKITKKIHMKGGSKHSYKHRDMNIVRISLSEYLMLGGDRHKSFIRTHWDIYNQPNMLFEESFLNKLLKYASSETTAIVKSYIKDIKKKAELKPMEYLQKITEPYKDKDKHFTEYLKEIMEHKPNLEMDEENGQVTMKFDTHTDVWNAQYIGAIKDNKIIWFWNLFASDNESDMKIPECALELSYMGKILFGEIFGFAPFKEGTTEVEDLEKVIGTIQVLLMAIYDTKGNTIISYQQGEYNYIYFLVDKLEKVNPN